MIFRVIWFFIKVILLILPLFGIMSILSIVFFPIGYWSRRYGYDELWVIMNDESMYGEQWWRDREGIIKDTFWVAWLWNIRNSAWNFKLLLNPVWNGSYNIYKSFTTTGEHPMTWANRDRGIYGIMIVLYEVEGSMYGRISCAWRYFEFQLGSAGNRYKLRIKIAYILAIKDLSRKLTKTTIRLCRKLRYLLRSTTPD